MSFPVKQQNAASPELRLLSQRDMDGPPLTSVRPCARVTITCTSQCLLSGHHASLGASAPPQPPCPPSAPTPPAPGLWAALAAVLAAL